MNVTPRLLLIGGLAIAGTLAGCTGLPTPNERNALRAHQAVERLYRPHGQSPNLPVLHAESPMSEFLRFALLNHPQVEAAYHDWAASVQRITVERSLPDPRLTFEADLSDVVMSLMPGLMMDIPGQGKLRAAAGMAAAESQGKFFAFESALLQAAFTFKKAYYELYFIDAKIGINRQSLSLLTELERLARSQLEVGTVTLQDVLRAQIEQDRLATEIENIEDSRAPLLSQFKAALGMRLEDPTPPIPGKFESTQVDLTADGLLAAALARNPQLRMMQTEIDRAEAALRLAHKGRVPDFSIGLEADFKASPIFVTPQAGMTLPIWRDKIHAQIAAAQAEKRSAQARLSAEQIALAVEFAEKAFVVREATRKLELLTARLLPKARQSMDVARIGYTSGKVDFINLIDAQRTLLEFELNEVEARTQRELALAELSLLVLGVAPSGTIELPANPK